MEIIPAKEIINSLMLTRDQKIQRFNELVRAERDNLLKKNPDNITFNVELLFAMFGDSKKDIQFIIDQGYHVYNGCMSDRWVVELFPSRLSIAAQLAETSDSKVPTAEEVHNSMSSIESRRLAIFKKRVDEERNKTDPTVFKVYLDPNDFPDEHDVEFIRELGYDIIKVDNNAIIHGDWNWVITLPGEK